MFKTLTSFGHLPLAEAEAAYTTFLTNHTVEKAEQKGIHLFFQWAKSQEAHLLDTNVLLGWYQFLTTGNPHAISMDATYFKPFSQLCKSYVPAELNFAYQEMLPEALPTPLPNAIREIVIAYASPNQISIDFLCALIKKHLLKVTYKNEAYEILFDHLFANPGDLNAERLMEAIQHVPPELGMIKKYANKILDIFYPPFTEEEQYQRWQRYQPLLGALGDIESKHLFPRLMGNEVFKHLKGYAHIEPSFNTLPKSEDFKAFFLKQQAKSSNDPAPDSSPVHPHKKLLDEIRGKKISEEYKASYHLRLPHDAVILNEFLWVAIHYHDWGVAGFLFQEMGRQFNKPRNPFFLDNDNSFLYQVEVPLFLYRILLSNGSLSADLLKKMLQRVRTIGNFSLTEAVFFLLLNSLPRGTSLPIELNILFEEDHIGLLIHWLKPHLNNEDYYGDQSLFIQLFTERMKSFLNDPAPVNKAYRLNHLHQIKVEALRIITRGNLNPSMTSAFNQILFHSMLCARHGKDIPLAVFDYQSEELWAHLIMVLKQEMVEIPERVYNLIIHHKMLPVPSRQRKTLMSAALSYWRANEKEYKYKEFDLGKILIWDFDFAHSSDFRDKLSVDDENKPALIRAFLATHLFYQSNTLYNNQIPKHNQRILCEYLGDVFRDKLTTPWRGKISNDPLLAYKQYQQDFSALSAHLLKESTIADLSLLLKTELNNQLTSFPLCKQIIRLLCLCPQKDSPKAQKIIEDACKKAGTTVELTYYLLNAKALLNLKVKTKRTEKFQALYLKLIHTVFEYEEADVTFDSISAREEGVEQDIKNFEDISDKALLATLKSQIVAEYELLNKNEVSLEEIANWAVAKMLISLNSKTQAERLTNICESLALLMTLPDLVALRPYIAELKIPTGRELTLEDFKDMPTMIKKEKEKLAKYPPMTLAIYLLNALDEKLAKLAPQKTLTLGDQLRLKQQPQFTAMVNQENNFLFFGTSNPSKTAPFTFNPQGPG